MNATADTPPEAPLAALLAEYEEALTNDNYKDRDCHWQIAERWYRGEHLGWFVEHHGYRYGGLDRDYGQDGPHPTHAAAVDCMADHLRRAIQATEEDDDWEGGP